MKLKNQAEKQQVLTQKKQKCYKSLFRRMALLLSRKSEEKIKFNPQQFLKVRYNPPIHLIQSK